MSNYDGRLTSLIYVNEDIEVYIGRDQSVKIFDGKADRIITSPDGLKFKAYDNLGLLQQEYITEEYQSEWRDTDVGVIIRAIVEESKWGITGKYVRTDTGVTVSRVNYRWKTRLAALNDLIKLANTDSKKFTLYCDRNGHIVFRRYDDDEFIVTHMTTEEDLDHVVEDLNDIYTNCLLFFEKLTDISGTEYILDKSIYEHNASISGILTVKGKHRTKGFSMDFGNSSSNRATISGGSDMDIFNGQSWTVDIIFYPFSIGGGGCRLIRDTSGSMLFSLIARASFTDIAIDVAGSPSLFEWYPSVGWDTNEWNYLTLVGDGDNVYLYKNGSLVASTSKSPSGDWEGWSDEDVYINESGYAYDGLVDMVRFSSKAYSSTEIYNYTRIQSCDTILTDIVKEEMGGEKYNHCIVKYTDDIWAQYPDPMPNNPVTKFITTTSERTNHDCYLRAKAVVLTHRETPTRYKATAYTSRCDYRPNDLVEIYAPRYGIVGNFRLKDLTYTIRDNTRKLSMTLGEEREELTSLLEIAGL